MHFTMTSENESMNSRNRLKGGRGDGNGIKERTGVSKFWAKKSPPLCSERTLKNNGRVSPGEGSPSLRLVLFSVGLVLLETCHCQAGKLIKNVTGLDVDTFCWTGIFRKHFRPGLGRGAARPVSSPDPDAVLIEKWESWPKLVQN